MTVHDIPPFLAFQNSSSPRLKMRAWAFPSWTAFLLALFGRVFHIQIFWLNGKNCCSLHILVMSPVAKPLPQHTRITCDLLLNNEIYTFQVNIPEARQTTHASIEPAYTHHRARRISRANLQELSRRKICNPGLLETGRHVRNKPGDLVDWRFLVGCSSERYFGPFVYIYRFCSSE